MKHKKAKRLLFQYLLKTLTPGKQKKIESHLEACEICRKEHQYLKLIRAQAKSTARFELSDTVLEAAKLSMREEYRKVSAPGAEEPNDIGKRLGLRDMADRFMARLRWMLQPAGLASLLLLISLIIYGIIMLENNGLVAFNLPFTLFRSAQVH
jgi:hypothetical protein